MFLYSGRGYWQELIESILWAHHKLKIMPHIQPRALSISQGRAVGFIHYTLGGVGCTWARDFTIRPIFYTFHDFPAHDAEIKKIDPLIGTSQRRKAKITISSSTSRFNNLRWILRVKRG